MENTTDNMKDQAGSAAEKPSVTAGKMLAEARERLGLTVMDVAMQIKFAPKQIEALEADDYQRLPEPAFLRGFVRSYAKILHLDPQPLLAALPLEKAAQGLAVEPGGETIPGIRAAGQRQNFIWLGASLVMIAIVAGFAIWHFSSPPIEVETPEVEAAPAVPTQDIEVDPAELASKADAGAPEPAVQQPPVAAPAQAAVPPASAVPPRPSPQAPAAQPPAPPPAPQAEAAPAAEQPALPVRLSRLELIFNGESWTEVTDRDGKILSSRLNEPGDELKLKGAAPITLVIGNASLVRLFYEGKEIDLAPHTRASSDVANLTLE